LFIAFPFVRVCQRTKANGNKWVQGLEGSTIARLVDRDDFRSLVRVTSVNPAIQLYDFAETMPMASDGASQGALFFVFFVATVVAGTIEFDRIHVIKSRESIPHALKSGKYFAFLYRDIE